jgi:uncharacterized protein involved in exopolysaccharide biosynthesis
LSLKRDYDNILATHNSLLARKLEAEIAVNMERKQKGEQFRVLDSARLPEKPIKPDMKKLFVSSWVQAWPWAAESFFCLNTWTTP